MRRSPSARGWTIVAGLAVALIGAVGYLLVPGPTTAADGAAKVWAMFGGTVSRNMINLNEKGITDEFEVKQKKGVKWQADLGSRAYGGPTIANGVILVGTNNERPRDPKVKGDKGIVMAFDQETGKYLYQIVHNKLSSGQVNDWPREGVCSSPTIIDGQGFYTSNRCETVCIDTKTGKVVWSYDMMKELNVFPHNMTCCSPLVVNDLVFIVTANGVDEGHINIPSPEAPSFVALERKTGKLVWKDASPGKNIMHGQWANPTYGEIGGVPQVIFPGGDGWLYAFEPKTGKPLWKFDCNPKTAPKYELGGKGIRSDFIATAVVYEGKIYIGIGQDPEHYEGVGYFWCIDPAGKSGDLSRELVDMDNPDLTKRTTKPNPNTGLVWVYGGPNKEPDAKRDYIFGRTMSTASIHDGIIYIAELAGYLHCLDLKTGKPFWVHDLKSAVWGSTYWVDGKIYIGTEDGDVWVFKHGKEKPDPKQIAIDQPIRSTPVVANGVLYVMTESTLFALTAPK
jgi:outer membrane protein assembly factor BamB